MANRGQFFGESSKQFQPRMRNSSEKVHRQRQRQDQIANYGNYSPPSTTAPALTRVLLNRTSNLEVKGICEHCAHNHAQKCCLYVYDDDSDIFKYSSFKKEIDRPYYILSTTEDFDLEIGATTPTHFPGFTEVDARKFEPPKIIYNIQPMLYFRQWLWPMIYLTPYNGYNFPQYPNGIRYNYHIPHPYISPVMRQLSIPLQRDIFQSTFMEPKIVEVHNFVPIHPC